MTGVTFPPIRWRRLDVPGEEEAHLEEISGGWVLRGELEVEFEGETAGLSYRILCDTGWRTRRAVVSGRIEDTAVQLELRADGRGHWLVGGTPLPVVNGALDVDLGVTPSTNTLAIRRLSLGVGESAPVRASWFRFPELRVEPLEQIYTREAERVYRYEAVVDGERFRARLDTDAVGWVVRYEALWEALPAS